MNQQQQQQQPQDKRQYLLAQPRIGRSPLQAGYLTSGTGQAQNSLFPPLSSIVFYAGNSRRVVAPRSGLLPQARIGRRASAAPMGLMPQPRVGRRSGAVLDHLPHRINYNGLPMFTFADSRPTLSGTNDKKNMNGQSLFDEVSNNNDNGQLEVPTESINDSSTTLDDILGGSISW